MRDASVLGDLPCELLLNGVSMRSVKIRQTAEAAGDFEIVVTDPLLGAFALHSGFDIEVHEPDAGRRRISLDELKAVLNRRNPISADDLAKASEIAGCRLFAKVDDIEIPKWNRARFSELGPEGACVRYVQRIFFRVGIPHIVSGTTFLVPSAPTARIPLKRAGFRRSTISRSALLEPRTNVTVQLVERDPSR